MDLLCEARSLLVKVCGNTDEGNLRSVAAEEPDLVGFIFAPGSPRVVTVTQATGLARAAEAAGVRSVGVFRNAPLSDVVQVVGTVGLGMVQLHGSEDLGYISELRQSVPSLAIIKAVPVENGASILESRGFDRAADLLIFDTASKEGGGSGVVFDWSVLGGYKGEAPFLVAGGVGPDNANKLLLQCRQFEKFRGVDLNSAVESSPGVKDVSKVAEVIRKMRDV